ncbi:HET-domain-containing protein [Annulohypoxylon moriforme]|nr:HET-domain-containing protein [Annulohypoxylon moriforme]
MPVFNGYHYEPLSADNEIRLIELKPARREEAPLKCSITQHRHSVRKDDCFAISYVWGEPEFSRNLEITGDGDVSYLRITPNLDVLLRYLRKLRTLRHFWIDAICLNQADEMEKAHQIPIMGRIFGEAKGVHIWLGPDDILTTKLFTFFRCISQLPEVEKMKMAQSIVDVMLKIFGNTGTAMHCLFDFFERAWFSRRWIIQEARLAREATVHCGNCSIPLPVLSSAATRFQSLDMSSYPIKMMANLNSPASNSTILELLWTFQEARCLEPKDRVAALFDLSQNNYGFYLDYTVHWTEMYKQIALSALRNGDNETKLQLMLHLFEFGAVHAPFNVDYPSWVPDWSNTRRRDLPYHSPINTMDTYEPYPTSPGYPSKATLTLHHDTLNVHWNASISGSQVWQVTYVTRFDSPIHTEDLKTQGVKNLLLEFFPSASTSIFPILAVSALFEHIGQLCYPNQHLRLKSSPWDDFIVNIIQQLPKMFHTKVLDTLRQTSRLLDDFCIFKMKSIGSRYQDSVGYGVSSQQLQPGDTMIPLWNMIWEHELGLSRIKEYKYLRTKTMLAVRPTQRQSPQQSTVILDKEDSVETSQIVGWAVCVLLKHESACECDLSVDTMWDDDSSGEQECSIRLI